MSSWPLKETALGQYTGDLFIRNVWASTWIDMGAVRALVANLDWTSITEINSDNRGTLIRFSDLLANISVTSLETFDRDKMNILFNTVSSNVAGTKVEDVSEEIWTDVTAGTIYTLLNKNWDNSKIATADIAVTDTTGTLVLNTDYTVAVDSNGFTYIVILVTTTGLTKVEYDYTPNSAEQAVITLGTNALKNFEVKIEAIIPNSVNKRTISLSSATLNSTYSLGFQDPIEAGDLAGADLVFEWTKKWTLTYYDEVLS